MFFRRKILIINIIFTLIILFLLNINNPQKSSFRFLIWNIRDVSIGKLIWISFIAGTSISTVLNLNINSNSKNDSLFNKDSLNEDNIYASNTNDENSTVDSPPQRDVRDVQPTISVNYRIIKNASKYDEGSKNNISNKAIIRDDWDNDETEW